MPTTETRDVPDGCPHRPWRGQPRLGPQSRSHKSCSDVLELDGQPTLRLPYRERRVILESLEFSRICHVCPRFDDGRALWAWGRWGSTGLRAWSRSVWASPTGRANDHGSSGRTRPGRAIRPSWRRSSPNARMTTCVSLASPRPAEPCEPKAVKPTGARPWTAAGVMLGSPGTYFPGRCRGGEVGVNPALSRSCDAPLRGTSQVDRTTPKRTSALEGRDGSGGAGRRASYSADAEVFV